MPHLVGEVAAPAVLAFDAAGRLLHRSASATALLASLEGAEGALERRATLDAVPAVVSRAVGDAITGAPSGGIVRGHDGRHYVVQTVPAADDPADPGAPRTYVVIAEALPNASPPAAAHETSTLAARYGLSPREHEMLRRVARGDATKAIAAALGLSMHTVQEYVGRACRKVGVRTRRELVARLLAPPGEPEPATGASVP